MEIDRPVDLELNKSLSTSEPQKQPRQILGPMLMWIISIYLTVVIFCFILNHFFNFQKYVNEFTENLDRLFKTEPFLVYSIFFVVYLTSALLMIPSHTFIGCILLAIVDNILHSVVFILFTSVMIHIVFCLLIKWKSSWTVDKVKDTELVLIVAEQSKKSPFRTAFLLRILVVPIAVHDIILISVENPFWSYILSANLVDLILLVDSNTMKIQATYLKYLLTKKSKGEAILVTEILWFIFLMLLLLTTIIVSIFISIWARNKLKEKHLLEEQEKEKMSNSSTKADSMIGKPRLSSS